MWLITLAVSWSSHPILRLASARTCLESHYQMARKQSSSMNGLLMSRGGARICSNFFKTGPDTRLHSLVRECAMASLLQLSIAMTFRYL
jgi:hypothetical protein